MSESLNLWGETGLAFGCVYKSGKQELRNTVLKADENHNHCP